MGKLRKQIESAARRRARHVRPQAARPAKLTVTAAERDAFTSHHADKLMSVETVIAQLAKHHPEVDDFVVEQALRAGIRSHAAADPFAQVLTDLLEKTRQADNIDAEIWQSALRVIYTSVTTRSDCHRGDFAYLAYVAKFLERARGL